MITRFIRCAACCVMLLLSACDRNAPRPPSPADSANDPAASMGEVRAFFTEAPDAPRDIPSVARLTLPEIEGADAIWGGTGRDDRGHLWFGVCSESGEGNSAVLLEYIPETGTMTVRGNVVEELKRAGVHREGETQAKIHSRIVQAADGHLYFASTSIEGADYAEGRTPPTWGGHLWRYRIADNRWEHLAATPEKGLIAVAGRGRYVYALGFFDHELYQYDTQTGELRSVTVGSAGGHISRNFVVDVNGHAYVPRLIPKRNPADTVVTLAEYDTDLDKVNETPMKHYVGNSTADSHGLTAFQPLADGSIIISTAFGYLMRIHPIASGPAEVEEMGWLHPDGARYVASLFTYAGTRYVIGLATQSKDTAGDKTYDWVVYHLATKGGLPVAISVKAEEPLPLNECLLYGSVTRDNAGNFYVVGSHWPRREPLLLRIACPD